MAEVEKRLFSYANGWEHMIMSLAMLGTGVILILLSPDTVIRGTGVSLILTVMSAWFIPNAARSAVQEVVKQWPPASNVPPASGGPVPPASGPSS